MKPHNEDKQAWCAEGLRMEHEFCKRFGDNLNVQMNPEKDDSPYVPDLVDCNGLADLKTQNEPFYRSHTYGLNPIQSVSLNKKDIARYHDKYPKITVYFWVKYVGGIRFNVSVPRMEAVYKVSISEVVSLIGSNQVPLHHYNNRREDKVNARCSYLIDTTLLKQVWPI